MISVATLDDRWAAAALQRARFTDPEFVRRVFIMPNTKSTAVLTKRDDSSAK